MPVDTSFLEQEYGERIAQRKETFTLAFNLFSREFHKNHHGRELVCTHSQQLKPHTSTSTIFNYKIR